MPAPTYALGIGSLVRLTFLRPMLAMLNRMAGSAESHEVVHRVMRPIMIPMMDDDLARCGLAANGTGSPVSNEHEFAEPAEMAGVIPFAESRLMQRRNTPCATLFRYTLGVPFAIPLLWRSTNG